MMPRTSLRTICLNILSKFSRITTTTSRVTIVWSNSQALRGNKCLSRPQITFQAAQLNNTKISSSSSSCLKCWMWLKKAALWVIQQIRICRMTTAWKSPRSITTGNKSSKLKQFKELQARSGDSFRRLKSLSISSMMLSQQACNEIRFVFF